MLTQPPPERYMLSAELEGGVAPALKVALQVPETLLLQRSG
jgi:hypothetical protein